jgi:hypothetical protein
VSEAVIVVQELMEALTVMANEYRCNCPDPRCRFGKMDRANVDALALGRLFLKRYARATPLVTEEN